MEYNNEDWIRLKDFQKKYNNLFSMNSLRWIIFNCEKNGSSTFIRRLGNKLILISPSKFFKWIDEQGFKPDSPTQD